MPVATAAGSSPTMAARQVVITGRIRSIPA